MKISKILKLALIVLISLFCIQFIPNKVEAASKPTLKVSYSYNKKDDVVIVKVKSNMKFKKTKPSWTLSKDKKTYSKKFYKNETYSTKFMVTNGKSKTVKIKVKQIKGPKITISYKYDKNTNKVKVTVKSNKKFKNTKPTWSLSKNKKTYTKTFKNNETYTTPFYDTYGNKKNVKIKVKQVDKKGPKAHITYDYNSSNNTVLVTIKANEELKENSLNSKWTLSKNKKVFTRTFYVNTNFDITLKDKFGNKTKGKIIIDLIDDVPPKVTTKYNYSADKNSAIVTLTANEELSSSLVNDGWQLSSDKRTYTKQFKRNGTYSVIVNDKYNNGAKLSIKISGLIYKGIDVSSHQSRINWVDVKQDGIDFAILRLGWIGNKNNHTIDTFFNENYEACKRLGIPVGVYVYNYCESEEAVTSGAKWVLDQLKAKKLTYPVYIDMEDSQISGLDKEKLTNISKTFCEEIKKGGYSKVGVYANKNWLINKLDANQLSSYNIWLAHYTSKTDYAGKYQIWQYTSSGSVKGIIGRVDMNYCYKNY